MHYSVDSRGRTRSSVFEYAIKLLAAYSGNFGRSSILRKVVVHTCLWPHYFSPLRKIPGPKDGNFLLGQILNQVRALPSELETKWMKENPESPFIRYLLILNLEVLMLLYWRRIVGEIAGIGILFTEGQEHRRQRKLLLPLFAFGNIKRLLPFFEQKALETSAIISKSLDESKDIIDVSTLLSRTTLDIVGLAALGYELNTLNSLSPLAVNYEKIFEFATTMQILISYINQFVPIRPLLPFKANRDYVNANTEVCRMLQEMIRKRKDEYRRGELHGEKASRDLLTLMIEESVDVWSEDEMLGYLLNFMSAGHETTAGTMVWALYALTLHPQVQTRLRSEIIAGIKSSTPSQRDLDSLAYLNNFTKEVLRFYPPAPKFPREAAEDLEIEGVVIPKGTAIIVAPAAPHFNPTIWGDSAHEFNSD
ncbi:cytochrome P450 [Sarocladium strictum]